jgi:hypothetical protein
LKNTRVGILALVFTSVACGGRLAGTDGAVDAAVSTAPPACVPLGCSSVSDAGDWFADAGGSLEDAGVDMSELAPCLQGGNILYVAGQWLSVGLSGHDAIDGDGGTWTSTVYGYSDRVAIETSGGEWSFMMASLDGLRPGTYVCNGTVSGNFIDVEVYGATCADPTGSFTIAEVGTTGGANDVLTTLLASFELPGCTPDAGASLRGCISYGR